jgi:hypothetical protein
MSILEKELDCGILMDYKALPYLWWLGTERQEGTLVSVGVKCACALFMSDTCTGDAFY